MLDALEPLGKPATAEGPDEADRRTSSSTTGSTCSSPTPTTAGHALAARERHRSGRRAREGRRGVPDGRRADRGRASDEPGEEQGGRGEEAPLLPRRPHLRDVEGAATRPRRIYAQHPRARPDRRHRVQRPRGAPQGARQARGARRDAPPAQRDARERTASAPGRSTRSGTSTCGELDDKDQGSSPSPRRSPRSRSSDDYAADLERAAGSDMKIWSEALQILSQATHPARRCRPRPKLALFNRLGRWYSEKIARPDLGLPCFQVVLGARPRERGGAGGALAASTAAPSSGRSSARSCSRAPTAPRPPRRRATSAPRPPSSFETRLSERGPRARPLRADLQPRTRGTRRTCEALLSDLPARSRITPGYAKILERRAEALQRRGSGRDDLQDRRALRGPARRPRRGDAPLRGGARARSGRASRRCEGLDRIYNRAGSYKELLENLGATDRRQRDAAPEDQPLRAASPASTTRSSSTTRRPPRPSRRSSRSTAPTRARSPRLVRHYRALDRWEDVVPLYEKHLGIVSEDKRREELLLAMGRVLLDQIGSPERARKAVREGARDRSEPRAARSESLAHVRAATGDAVAALERDRVARGERRRTPRAGADLWIRAAKMLEEKRRSGRRHRALQEGPRRPAAERGRVLGAARGLPRPRRRDERRRADRARRPRPPRATSPKAASYGEMAQLLRERLKDDGRAGGGRDEGGRPRSDERAGPHDLGRPRLRGGPLPRGGEALRARSRAGVDVLPKEQGLGCSSATSTRSARAARPARRSAR